MYFCVDKNEDIYTVLDTSDGVEEQCSKDDLLRYLDLGIEIHGVTRESLSINEVTTVVIDYPSIITGIGQIFNGYFFEGYDRDDYDYLHSAFMFSVISSKDCDCKDIVQYLQRVNKNIFNEVQRGIRIGRLVTRFQNILEVVS